MDKTMYWFNVYETTYRATQYCFCVLALYLLGTLLRHLILQHCMNHQTFCSRKNTYSRECSTANRSSSLGKTHSQTSDVSTFRKPSWKRLRSYRYRSTVRFASHAMICLSLSASIFTIFHILLDLWVFADKSRALPITLCVRQSLSGILYLLCAFCVYTFLWIRQRIFYAHPVLRHLAGPILNRFSWSVFFTIVTSLLTFIVLYTIPNFDEWSKFYERNSSSSLSANWTSIVMQNWTENPSFVNRSHHQHICTFRKKKVFILVHFVGTLMFVYFQISLQALFAYPVICNRGNQKTSKRKDKRTTSLTNRDETENSEKIMTKKIQDFQQINLPMNKNLSETSFHTFNARGQSSGGEFSGVYTDEVNTTQPCDSKVISLKSVSEENVIAFSHGSSSQKDAGFITVKCEAEGKKQSYLKKKEKCAKRNESLKNDISVETSLNLGDASSNFKKRSVLKKKKQKTKNNLKRNKRIQKRLRVYVWRCFGVSLVCCLSDLIAFAFNLYTQLSAHEVYKEDRASLNPLAVSSGVEEAVTVSMLTSLAYNGNMVINLFCLVLCYDKWPSMLFFCCIKTPTRKTARQ